MTPRLTRTVIGTTCLKLIWLLKVCFVLFFFLICFQSAVKDDSLTGLKDNDDPLDIMSEEVINVLEDEVTETEQEQSVNPDEEPLYAGCRRKLGMTILLLIIFIIRFRLSDEAIQYLITLLGLLLPDNSKLVGSLYQLRKYLQKLTFLPEIQYYCAFCYTHVRKGDKLCKNEICKKDLTQSNSMAYFVRHSLVKQLSTLFKREKFTELVRNHRFAHFEKVRSNSICDVYDGQLYKDLFNSGFLSNRNNISFSMNTDGVSIFKSSSTSMWPVYLLINELPIKQRKARENTLFYGFWISPKKPIMWCFMKPLYEELAELEKGVQFSDHNGDLFLCQATLLSCVCDLPAKCLVTNSMQFNGQFGCWHCLQPGETFRTESGGHCHVFPFNKENPDGPPRSSESVKADVKAAVQKIKDGKKQYVTNGVKGPFWLMFLTHFNFIDGMIIDYMHGICSGVMKLLLNLWFGSGNRGSKFSFYQSRKTVNSLLTKIKPILDITRVPRSLDEMGWKSSEYRNFLLFWGIPVLSEILPYVYFVHFKLLVKGIFLLSKEIITVSDLEQADQCLHLFVEGFAELYSLRFMTMNIHQVIHLTKCVRLNGPLFVNNCFVYEDLNGFITQYIHGTQGIDTQVVHTVNIIHALPVLHEQFAKDDPEALEYIDKLNNQTYNTRSHITGDIYCVGKAEWREVSDDEYNAVCLMLSCTQSFGRRFKCWYKIYIKNLNLYVYGSLYKRMKRRNQSVIKYIHGDGSSIKLGSVKFFMQLCSDVNVAVVNPFHVDKYINSSNITPVTPCSNEHQIVNVQNILDVCIYVDLGDKHFVCELPNRHDKD